LEEVKNRREPGTSGSHLATWDIESRRITVQGQPRQIVPKTPSPK
jgi:hypothetical protein